QSDKNYLNHLINYNKVLAQRNALLKYFALNNTFNSQTLEVYNAQLQNYGSEIFKIRKDFLEASISIFKSRHNVVRNNKESVHLNYYSDVLDDELDVVLKQDLSKDKALQDTSVRIHKDDMNFEIGDYPIKKLGRRGQQKPFLIALKL